ncbi:hypothetical protein MHYP_G00188070 [Metynnis hypsauchen]
MKEKPYSQRSSSKFTISVHKTDICTEDDFTRGTISKQNENPAKKCLIHNKSHPLKKFRAFRGMPWEERKVFLRQNGIAIDVALHPFTWLDTVKCTECDNDCHVSVIHPGPVPQESRNSISTPENIEKGEKGPTKASNIDCHCTEVCGETQAPRSCAKLCLVRVFQRGQRDKGVKMYAVLDDQSNRSLARQLTRPLDAEAGTDPTCLKSYLRLQTSLSRQSRQRLTWKS